jgi:immunity protein Imm1 of predicted polymorphic toxin system
VWRVKDLANSGLGREAPEVTVADEQGFRSELARLASLEPRVVGIELSGNEYLQVGLGGPWAFVEHVVDEPWKAEAALPRVGAGAKPESVWFMCGGQGSEIPARYLLPKVEAVEAVVECLRLGGASPAWEWELV